jgi:hypothetical protein
LICLPTIALILFDPRKATVLREQQLSAAFMTVVTGNCHHHPAQHT